MSKLQCENTRQLFGCVCVFVWFGSFSLFCLFCWLGTNPHEQFTMLSTGNLRGWSSRMYQRSCWQQHRCVRRRVGKTPTSVVLGNNLCVWFWFVRWEPPPRAIFHQRGCWQQHRCAERVFGKPPSSVVLWKQPSFLFVSFVWNHPHEQVTM